jgi:hypothetical protein
MIVLLKRDLDNRLLDLQRERGLAERLQKQLDNRDKLHSDLQSLRENQENITTQLAGCTGGITEVLDAKEHDGERFVKRLLCFLDAEHSRINECLTLISSLKESEAKISPALEELIRLIKGFSERYEAFQCPKFEDISAKND